MPRTLAAEEKAQNNSDFTETEVRDPERETRWTRIIVVLCLALAVATVVVVVIALEPSSSAVPADVDVVLYQVPETARMSRYVSQSRAVWKYMPWVRRIFVLSQYATPGWDPVFSLQVVAFTGSESAAFEFMPSIPEIAAHAIFLSDRTVPFRAVKKSYLFYQSRPRIFNVFREQSEVNFLEQYFELPTLPTLVTELQKLNEEPRTWQHLVFREMTEERVVLREDLNRDVFVVGGALANVQKQLDKLVSAPPVFATFHIHPDDPQAVEANQAIASFLGQQFP